MRNIVVELTQKILQKYAVICGVTDADLHAIEYDIEVPKKEGQGDLSVNIAFKLSRIAHKPPLAIAGELATLYRDCIEAHDDYARVVDSLVVAKPGFINFFFSAYSNTLILEEIYAKGADFGSNNFGKNERVLIEFVSANPTGPLTIAHGRQACIGDTLAAIMGKCGYQVSKEFYLNDGGNQINMLGRSVFARYLDLCGCAVPFPEDGYQGEYIIDIAQQIHREQGNAYADKNFDDVKTIRFFSDYAATDIMKGIQDDLAAILVAFDTYYSESTLYDQKIGIVLNELKVKNHCYEDGGALWFRSTAFGDDKDRVLIKADGSYTYLVPDIAYHKDKYNRGFTRIINLLGPDHHGYIARLKASMTALGYDAKKLDVIIVQLATLYDNGVPFKMSTRKGTFVSLHDLIDDVGADATRLFFLMKLTDSQLSFDRNLAKEQSQENPVYYFQYAYARISSILRLAEIKDVSAADLLLLSDPAELVLIKLMAEYSNVLVVAARQCEPYRVVDYLRELAAGFHKFYNVCRVISDDVELSKARLYLAECVRIVIGNGLSLLGVRQLERM